MNWAQKYWKNSADIKINAFDNNTSFQNTKPVIVASVRKGVISGSIDCEAEDAIECNILVEDEVIEHHRLNILAIGVDSAKGPYIDL